jgi:hypothetical protein
MLNLFRLQAMAICAAAFLLATSASAGNHTWDVVEVFSNFDGTIQFVELFDAGEIPPGNETGVGNGSLSSNAHFFSWSKGAVTAPTLGKRYLVATAGYAALALAQGAPAPDVIIPGANVPFFSISGDTITYSNGDVLTFGPVPTNGTESFDEAAGDDVLNSPENYVGATGSIVAPAAPSGVPIASAMMVVVLIVSLSTIAVSDIRRRRRDAAA